MDVKEVATQRLIDEANSYLSLEVTVPVVLYVPQYYKVGAEERNIYTKPVEELTSAVYSLSLAFFITRTEEYKIKAENLLTTWCIYNTDISTRDDSRLAAITKCQKLLLAYIILSDCGVGYSCKNYIINWIKTKIKRRKKTLNVNLNSFFSFFRLTIWFLFLSN
jgi:hypothetical protein